MKEELSGSPEWDKSKVWNLKRLQGLGKVPMVRNGLISEGTLKYNTKTTRVIELS